jgi:L-glutamine-phosphate cytidylyltransferase
MKAIILAAGQGTRIRAVHGERPKCLIEVDDETILDHQIDGLSKAGIDEIAIVVGYEKEHISSKIRHSHSPTTFIHFGSPAIGSTDTGSLA